MNDTEIQSFIGSCNQKGMTSGQAVVALTRKMILSGMTGAAMTEAVIRHKAQLRSTLQKAAAVMTESIPTVESILSATLIGNGLHRWPVEGGEIRIATAELRPALEAAYDQGMPDWPPMTEIEDA